MNDPLNKSENSDDVARGRWMVLQMVRLGGALMVFLGIAIISGRLIDIPEVGYVLLVAGAAEFFIFPVMLAKRWKSPDA